MDLDFLKTLKKTTERNLMDLSKKPEMSAAETKAAKDAMELLDYLDMKIEDCEMKEKGYPQYSGHAMDRAPYREYQITSYRSPQHRSYDGVMRGHYYNPSYGYDPYMYGYSGHSISDRAVSLMEGMMDGAKSDYEREQVKRFIEMIRAAA